MTKICVLGLGYIGLPTASLLANHGFRVVGVDVNPQVVKTINQGRIHIVEPGLDTVVRAAIQSGRLVAKTRPEKADAFIICVPTPILKDNTSDLSYVRAAAESLVPLVTKGNLIILESTSPPFTVRDVLLPVLSKSRWKPGKDLYLAYCPERVIPGHVIEELTGNDRVIGGLNPASAQKAKKIYETVVNGKIHLTDDATAEMVKLVENSFRDVNIAFANELSMICAGLGINVWEVIRIANCHPRVKILKPGPGVGGHCIAVDPWFIIEKAPATARLLRAAREVNNSKVDYVARKVQEAASRIKKKRPLIACFGLTYKADTDDTRESPAIEVAHRISRNAPGKVVACDPYVKAVDIKGLTLEPRIEKAADEADVLVFLVNHKQFSVLTPERYRNKAVVDACGMWAGR